MDFTVCDEETPSGKKDTHPLDSTTILYIYTFIMY